MLVIDAELFAKSLRGARETGFKCCASDFDSKALFHGRLGNHGIQLLGKRPDKGSPKAG